MTQQGGVYYPALTHQISGNTAGATTHISAGTYLLNAGANITLSQNSNSVTILGGAGAAGATFSGGVSTLGNTLGTTGMVSAQMVLVGGTNITLSQSSVAGGSATVTIIGGAGGAGGSFSAGVSTGGNTSGTTGTVSNQLLLVGGNNITLSQSSAAGGATVTISAFNQSVQPVPVVSNAIQSVASATGSGTNVSRFAADDHVHAGVFSMGVSTGGNTAGTTRVDVGRFVLAGGNSITLSQATAANALNTISIVGPTIATSAFSAGVSTGGNTLGTTGTVSNQVIFVGGNNVTLSQSSAAGGATITISAANETQTVPATGTTVSRVESANVVGTRTSRFALEDHQHAGLYQISVGGNTSGTTSAGAGSLHLAGGPNVTLSGSTAAGGLTLSISAPAPAAANYTFSGGMSTHGNTSGDTGYATQRLNLIGGTNITLSGSTDAGSMSISIIGAAAGTGGATYTYSAGMSTMGNTSGDTGYATDRLNLVGGNNVTLSGSTNAGSMTITISAGAAGAGALSAGMSTGGNTSGTTGLASQQLVLAGGNNVTLSGSTNAGSMTITISGGAAGGAFQSAGLSTGGNTSGNTGFATSHLQLAGINNITISGSTAGGGLSLTVSGANSAVPPTISFYNVIGGIGFNTATADLMQISISNATALLFPMNPANDIFPGNMTVGTVIIPWLANTTNTTASTEAYTSTLSFGLYTLANRTQLSLVNSGSTVWSSAANNSRSSLYSGLRWMTMVNSQFATTDVTLSNASYWGLMWIRTSGTSLHSGSVSPQGVRYAYGNTNVLSGFYNAASSTANSYARHQPFDGFYSASFTTAMPNAIAQSEMAYTGSGWAGIIPDVRLVASNASGIYGLV